MSDLISRSALLKYFEEEKEKIKGDSKKYHIHEEAVAGMEAALQAITNKVNEMPTAYDVEKVVAEIKEWSFETEIVIPKSDGFEDIENREIICTLNAIDIVRKGGAE